MRVQKRVVLYLIVALFAYSPLSASLRKGSTEFWGEAIGIRPIVPKWDFTIMTNQRFDIINNELFFVSGEYGWIYHASKCFQIVPSLRIIRVKDEQDWVTDLNPRISMTWSSQWRKWKYFIRQRIEYRTLDNRPIYRPRFKVAFPFEIPLIHFTPYFAEEFYIEKGFKFEQNRFLFSLERQFTEHFKTKLGYMMRFKREFTRNWQKDDILLFYLTFSL